MCSNNNNKKPTHESHRGHLQSLCERRVREGGRHNGLCENRLQGMVPAKLFRSKGGMWRSGADLKTMSRCSCMRMGVESAQDHYQNLCNSH